jgi:hypothetical protein
MMIQQALVDFLGKEIALIVGGFSVAWLMIFTLFGIYAIIRFCNQND